MLSLDFIRQNPRVVQEGLRRRRYTQNIDELLRHAEQKRGLTTRCDGLYRALKPLKETVKTDPVERRAELSRQIKAITQDIRQLELQIVDIDMRLQPLLLSGEGVKALTVIPNIPYNTANLLYRLIPGRNQTR